MILKKSHRNSDGSFCMSLVDPMDYFVNLAFMTLLPLMSSTK